MCTFGCSTLIETVAVGFSSAGRYSGPTHFAGAWVANVEAIAQLANGHVVMRSYNNTGSMVTTQEWNICQSIF
jgi:hypothetical protein